MNTTYKDLEITYPSGKKSPILKLRICEFEDGEIELDIIHAKQFVATKTRQGWAQVRPGTFISNAIFAVGKDIAEAELLFKEHLRKVLVRKPNLKDIKIT